MTEELKNWAKEAVEKSELLETSNEGKKRAAFAYVNEKIIENKVAGITDEVIDAMIEEAWKGL